MEDKKRYSGREWWEQTEVIKGTGVTIDEIISVLSDGFADSCGFDRVDNESSIIIENYKKAKAELIRDNVTDICLEDIQAKSLQQGGFIIVLEPEEGGGFWHSINARQLVDAIKKQKIDFEDADFYDFDAVLQIAAYGDVIYG